MSAPEVQLAAVTKRFGSGPLVLDRISLAAGGGEFVSLIGPSGCGKSTLLRLVAGLSPINSGTLTIGGAAPRKTGSEVAFVFQEATLLPWLTAAANVEIPLKLRGVAASARAETRRRVLELVRLGDKGGNYPRQLSGGQKMRVSLARALALSPRLMLLDEPFGALDEMTRERLNEELLDIHAQQAWTSLFVTHSVAEAVFLSHRVIVMSANPGRIHTEVLIPLAWPRRGEIRQAPEYHALVAQVSRVLRSVVTGAAA